MFGLSEKLCFKLLFLLMFGVLILQPGFAQNGDQKKAMQTLTGLSDAFESLSEFAGPAIVQIFASGYAPGDSRLISRRENSGSGVLLDPSGYIITNHHVIEGASQVMVLRSDPDKRDTKMRSILSAPRQKVIATVVGVDRETDLALLKIDGQGLPFLSLGDSDLLRSGQVVLAFGSPLGLENSVSMGVISAIARQLRPDDPMVYIQTDAPINPGSSGGPLLDTEGRVVGINTFIFSQSGGSDGLGFAAPGNIVKTVYEQLKANGRVRRGEIGVHAQTITPELARALGLTRNWGAILGDVYPGSPAATAGLQSGDIILSVNNKTIENGRQFDVTIYQRAIGDQVRLSVLRGKEHLNVAVTVFERPDDPHRFMEMVTPAENLIARLGILAIDISRRIEEMLPGLRKRFGVLVASAAPGSNDLQAGDVIYAVNGVEILGLRHLREWLANRQAGETLVLHIQRQGQLRYQTVFTE